MAFLMNRFLNMKLRSKFLLTYVVLILLTVLLIGTVTYYTSVNSIKSKITDFSSYLIEQIAKNLEKKTKDVEDFAFNQFRMSEVADKLMAEGVDSAGFNVMESKMMLNFLNDFIHTKPYLHSAYLWTPSGTAGPRANYVERNGSLMQELVSLLNPQEVRDNWGRAMWVPGDSGIVYMQKALYDVRSTKFLGVLVLGVYDGYIREIYDSIDTLSGGDIYIVNEKNELLLPSRSVNGFDPAFITKSLKERYFAANTSIRSERGTFLSTMISISNDRWKVLHLISVKELTQDTEAIAYWTVTTCVIALFLAFLIAAFLASNITENIRRLLQSMRQFSGDYTHKAVVPKGRDEVAMLAEKFNFMSEKINDLIHTVYAEKLSKQKAEYRTLQFEYKALLAQMNPHFLYNTLESIHSMAKLKGEDEIGELICLLGNLLRESIAKKGDFVSLSEEVEYIRKYLSIHQLIDSDKIEVFYEIDPSLMDVQVPRFVLQPIVENAIVHGIEAKPGKGVIRVRCQADTRDLIVEVTDNGIGMEEEVVRHLLQAEDRVQEDGQPAKHTQVGVNSVSKRIKMLCGDPFGLAIDSRPSEGTTIRIRLPMSIQGGLSQ
ncbi:MAG: sensor histidine kinase [Paenibacillus sp.]|jgi:two-component system sensor histidine kinase YesM|nr:sensor histidine kinase [Paenibacillus sp.]